MSEPNVDSPAPAAAPGADDLLSQMAGDEIDRLLAEAEPAKKSAPDTRKPGEAEAPVTAPNGADQTPDSGAPSTSGSASADRIDSLSKSMAELFKEKAAPAQTAEPEPAHPNDVVEAPPLTNQSATSPPLANDVTPAAVSAAPQEVGAPAPSAAAVSPKSSANDMATTDAVTREPMLIRVLELINAPLDHFDDVARFRIGMIGIVTLFNAIAALAYVHFVRKR